MARSHATPTNPDEDALTPEELIAARPALTRNAMAGLLLDRVPLAAIAQTYGTPCHVFAGDSFAARIACLHAAFAGTAIHYAVKANDGRSVLAAVCAAGIGADVVSGGELALALAAGIKPTKIVFSGVGKTGADILAAIAGGVQINAESPEEIAEISAIAVAHNTTARLAIRVNPDIDAGTHDKISTGRAGDKFGVPHDDIPALYAHCAGLPGITLCGLAVHIGSQIGDGGVFLRAYARLAGLIRDLRGAGQRVDLIDCGGGLGIAYRNEPIMTPQAWAGMIKTSFAGLDIACAIEPGRWLAGPCGVLLSRVIRVRRAGMARPMLILDAGMNDLLRPAMYQAYHGIIPVSPTALVAPLQDVDVVGPICESSDVFARRRMMPVPDVDGLVAILDTGAYGAVMASTYNARALAPRVFVSADKVGHD